MEEEVKVKVEYDGVIAGEATPYAIDAFVEILKNQADPEKNYATIQEKNSKKNSKKDVYTINHYKSDDKFEYVRIEEAQIEFAFEKDTQKLAFIINYKE